MYMPLFRRSDDRATLVRHGAFQSERELQRFVENNLDVMFNCRFVATEFSTGALHSGHRRVRVASC